MKNKNRSVWQSLVSKAARRLAIATVMFLGAIPAFAQRGATVPWTTYEAENMTISGGTVLGPQYGPNLVASESSGRECVQLNATGQYVQFTNQAAANAIVVRYSVPDTADGVGADYTLSLYLNGVFVEELPMTSRYSWLYGGYPFSNNPGDGSPRNFYDEVRANGLTINAGDVVRLQVGASDTAAFYDIDLVDLENVALPLAAPANSLSITAAPYNADNTGAADSTAALENCIAAASTGGESVWMPPGTYKISSTIYLPSNITIQGAGMWYTTLVGDPTLYANPADRVTFSGAGGNIHLSDFAIIGKLNYRNDSEPNDGLGGSYATGSTIRRLWVEHVKTGAWILDSYGLVIDSCRFRDTIADGCNINSGMENTLVTNCTCRGTGDDCFAMWPASAGGAYTPGLNVFTHCTGELPFLANGGAIYGGYNNEIENCLFQDLTYGCGILLSTTFSVGETFAGTTTAQQCDLIRCGGYDPGYQWRAALQICMDQYNGISGLNLNNLNITNSVSDGVSVIGSAGSLQNSVMANVSIPNYGIGTSGRNGLWARNDALGSLTVSNCVVTEDRDDSPNFTFNFEPLQFGYITNNSGITITGYDGPAGAVNIPGTINGLAVTSIGTNAFADADLSSVTIPSTVTNIGEYAFANCSDLTSVYFAGNAPSADPTAFLDDLATVYYAPGTTGWGTTFAGLPVTVEYFNYTTNNGTITITGYTGPGGAVSIPATINGLPVSSIGVDAFYNNGLTSVVIPNSVTSIGDEAFYYCTGLGNITFGTNLTTIGEEAFYYCPDLQNVTLPGSVTNIEEEAFEACYGLTAFNVSTNNPVYSSTNGVLFDARQATLIDYPAGLGGSYVIPNSVTSIADGAFAQTAVGGITIPAGVTNIGDQAFFFCFSLTAINVNTNNPAYLGANGVLFNKSQAILIAYPPALEGSYVIPTSVTNIADNAFGGSALGEITIPNSVITISDEAFYYCYNLTSITIPNSVTSIGEEAFDYCYSLSSLTVGSRVTSLGEFAFASCSDLTAAYFQGNAPGADSTLFEYGSDPTVYYLPGTIGWSGFALATGSPTALWWLPNPMILNNGVQTNRYGFTISWATNGSVVVEACTNLANPIWSPVATNALIGGSSYFNDPLWRNYRGRFYRINSQ